MSAPPLSDDALASAFTLTHGAAWKYVTAWGRWVTWTGTHWRTDETGAAIERVRLTCRASVSAADDHGLRRRIASERTIRAVERLARSDPRHAEPTDIWDRDSMLLNTPAGIVDLATGQVHPHAPEKFMTRMTAASPSDGCPRWQQFLDEVTGGDSEFAGYLARLAGYALTGSTEEQVFFFLHGTGANGKSVFIRMLSEILGTYAATAPLEAFMASRGERHPTDLAGLGGARFVSATETEPGRAWAESRIKAITGGDTFRVRYMHRDFFELHPAFKLIVAGNSRPILSGVGEAMRRRLHLVPFEVTIPSDRRDKALIETLRAERGGILAWMIEGCGAWRESGLRPPARIVAAVDEYFATEDVVGQWIEDSCMMGPEHRATARALFASWSDWVALAGHDRGTQRQLGEALRSRGFTQYRTGKERGWSGIAPVCTSDSSGSGERQ